MHRQTHGGTGQYGGGSTPHSPMVQQPYSPPITISGPIDPAFFAHHDALTAEQHLLALAPSELQSTETATQQAQLKLKQETKLMATAIAKETKHEHKLSKAQTGSSVLLLFAGGKRAAIETETSKVAIYSTQHAEHQANVSAVQEQLQRLAADTGVLQAKCARKRQVEAEAEAMVTYALATQPPTPRMQELAANGQACAARANENAMLMSDARCVVLHYEAAVAGFTHALQFERRAQMENNFAYMECDRGPYGGANGVEMMEQYARDADMNAAMAQAHMATAEVRAAVMSVSPAMKVRDPVLTQQLSTVPVALLQGQNFGQDMMMDMWMGSFGSFLNDARSGRKLRENMRMLRICLDIVGGHLALAQAFVAAVGVDSAGVHQTQRTIMEETQRERARAFQQLKGMVCGNGGGNNNNNSSAPPPSYAYYQAAAAAAGGGDGKQQEYMGGPPPEYNLPTASQPYNPSVAGTAPVDGSGSEADMAASAPPLCAAY